MTAAPLASSEGLDSRCEPADAAQAWPAERFYWSVLEAPGVPVRSLRPPAAAALDVGLASDLPVPIDEVHAVYARLDDRRVLACAVLKDELRSLPPCVVRVSPAAWPECLAGSFGAIPPGSINLLVGDFEPRQIRRARTRHAAWIAGGITLVGLLLSVGLVRRASAWSADADAARRAARGVTLAALPDEPVTSAVLPLRLKAELEQLRRTRRLTTRPGMTLDAAGDLAALLSIWPADLPAHTETVSVSPTVMSMNARLDGDPQPLLDGLGTIAGWQRDEPRVTRAGQGTSVVVQFRRRQAP